MGRLLRKCLCGSFLNPIPSHRMANEAEVKVGGITRAVFPSFFPFASSWQIVCCSIQYKTTASLSHLIDSRWRRSAAVCLAPLSVVLHSCLPLSTSRNNPTWHRKPSILIFFPATDLPKIPPPSLFLSLPFQKKKKKSLLQTTPAWLLTKKKWSSRLVPHLGEITNTFADALCSLTLKQFAARPFTPLSESWKIKSYKIRGIQTRL